MRLDVSFRFVSSIDVGLIVRALCKSNRALFHPSASRSAPGRPTRRVVQAFGQYIVLQLSDKLDSSFPATLSLNSEMFTVPFFLGIFTSFLAPRTFLACRCRSPATATQCEDQVEGCAALEGVLFGGLVVGPVGREGRVSSGILEERLW